jgi:IS30 family transposase
MEKKYKRLSFEERVKIETLLEEKRSRNYIAIHLKRSRSTINNEVRKWVVKPTDIYKASLSHWYSCEENQNKRTLDFIPVNLC